MATDQKKYTESEAVKKARENYESQGAYTSQWKSQIDDTVSGILNRPKFSYDVNADALYGQYKDRYVNLGQQAMADTMGQAAKLTGGYGNSNAQMVGQQAYQGYLQALTDKIPELAQLAYQRYTQEGQDLYQKYGMLSGQEQADYNRWNDERNFRYNAYNTERGFDYGQYRDTVGDSQWQSQFDEDARRYNQEWERKYGQSGRSGGGSGGGGGRSSGGSPGNNTYKNMQKEFSKGGYSASDINGAIAYQKDKGNISKNQADALRRDYYKPQVNKEVSEKSSKNDNSAYWTRNK